MAEQCDVVEIIEQIEDEATTEATTECTEILSESDLKYDDPSSNRQF